MTTYDFPNLSALHRASCTKLGPLPALRYKQDGLWHQISWDEYRRQADDLAAGLIGLGVKPGDRVAILSENRWEWVVADHAILSVGAVDVPIHAPSTPAQIQYQLEHSGSCGVIISNAAQWEKIAEIRAHLPGLKFVISCDPVDESVSAHVLSWDGIRQAGARSGAAGRKEIAAREASVTPDSLATIIYTSGTTSRPKGVMLSHGNLVSNSLSGGENFGIDCAKVWLNWLPLSHVFARTVDHYITTRMGVMVGLAQNMLTVMEDIREIQPHFFSSVPRLLEKVWAYVVSFPKEQRATEARRLLGSRLVQISSGGAPLPAHVATDLKEAGVTVLEGYGLTESSPIISFNERDHWKIGTVGRKISGIEVKIGPDGEVLTRGPLVMLGYWNDPAATKEAIQDGWLHTGDLGSIDAEGYLSITGRKKDLIVTAGGKNIAPAALEALLVNNSFIEQALVYGDRRPFVVGIIVPKFERIEEAIRQSGGAFSKSEEVVTDPTLIAWFQQQVDAALADVSKVERVKKIVVLTRPLSLDQDEMTVTQKVRRTAVFNRFQKFIDALYQDSSE